VRRSNRRRAAGAISACFNPNQREIQDQRTPIFFFHWGHGVCSVTRPRPRFQKYSSVPLPSTGKGGSGGFKGCPHRKRCFFRWTFTCSEIDPSAHLVRRVSDVFFPSELFSPPRGPPRPRRRKIARRRRNKATKGEKKAKFSRSVDSRIRNPRIEAGLQNSAIAGKKGKKNAMVHLPERVGSQLLPSATLPTVFREKSGPMKHAVGGRGKSDLGHPWAGEGPRERIQMAQRRHHLMSFRERSDYKFRRNNFSWFRGAISARPTSKTLNPRPKRHASPQGGEAQALFRAESHCRARKNNHSRAARYS